MKTLKVYDVDEFFRKEAKMSAFHYGSAAIIKGPNGVILAEHEAVHQVENLITDSVVIPLAAIPSKGGMAIMATHEATVRLCDIEEKAPYQEMTMEEFFDKRNYNPRCQTNFRILLESMREIGLDPKEYLQEQAKAKSTLSSQLKEAEKEKSVSQTNNAPVKEQGR